MNRLLKLILIVVCSGIAASAHAANFTVNMSGYQFVPKDLTVNVGDTVTWVNRDSTGHDTVSGVNLVPSGVWRSGLFGRNGSYSFTFNVAAGTYPYYCTPHIFTFNMVGIITVVAPNAPPSVTITNPPNNSSFTAGADVVIQANATDDNGVARVEFYSDGNLVGTDSSAPYSATLTSVGAGNYSLTARAFDGAGLSATSSVVNISVREPATAPAILTQPQSASVLPGSDVSFSVTATGTPPLNYQWQFNGANLPGATTNSLFLGNVQTNDAGSYSVIVSNEAGSTPSASAILNVTKLPNILPTVAVTKPANGARFRVGSNLAIGADASDADGQIAQVELFLNGQSFATLTNSPYEIVLTNLPSGSYLAAAQATDNDGGVTISEAIGFSLLAPPSIALTLPADGTRVGLGSNILIAATVSAPGLRASSVQIFERVEDRFEAITPALTNQPYSSIWTPGLAGLHTLMAVATDELGGTNVSQFVSINVLDPGTQNPTIAITDSPPNHSRLTASPVFISGIASDDILLERVQFQLNGGPFLPATGTTNWTVRLDLVAGTNVVVFRSVDFAGNFSTNATLALVYVVNQMRLNIDPSGAGRVTPNLNGQLLEIGKSYQMIARPASGKIFGGWSGGIVSDTTVLNFTMQSNLALTASFIANPFPRVKGNYSGLIFDTNGVSARSSGMIKLNVTGNGKYSGKLTIAEKSFPLRGQFDYRGYSKLPVLRRPIQPVVLAMNLDLDGQKGINGELTDGFWTSVVSAEHVTANSAGKNSSAGWFAFDLLNGNQSLGNGIAQLNQGVKISAHLSFSSTVVKRFTPTDSGSIPVYLPLRNGAEVLLGWLEFAHSPMVGIFGDLILGTTNGIAPVIMISPR